jgi:predicted neuraminidase
MLTINLPEGVSMRLPVLRKTVLAAVLAAFSLLSTASVASADETPISVKPGLFDLSNSKTLGLTVVPGEHVSLYRAEQGDHQFCHHPSLVRFKGRFHCIWSNGVVGEDELGQRILISSSDHGLKWSTPQPLAIDPTNRGACVAAGFLVSESRLTAFYTVTGGSNFHPDTAVWAKTSTNGKQWSQPQRVQSGFFIEGPKRLADGRLLLSGEHVGDARNTKRMRLLYSDQRDALAGWKEAEINPRPLKTFGYTEPNLIRRADGSLLMLFRNYSGFLYGSVSRDNGAGWSNPVQTNFPDSTARFATGQLPDGTKWIINNPGPKKFDRSLLTIAISSDGVVFDRAFIVRGEPTQMRYEGKSKLDGWQYPHAIVHDGHLFVAYSINKEDVGLTKIDLKNLAR